MREVLLGTTADVLGCGEELQHQVRLPMMLLRLSPQRERGAAALSLDASSRLALAPASAWAVLVGGRLTGEVPPLQEMCQCVEMTSRQRLDLRYCCSSSIYRGIGAMAVYLGVSSQPAWSVYGKEKPAGEVLTQQLMQ